MGLTLTKGFSLDTVEKSSISRNVALLGSTGSIGESTLDVISHLDSIFLSLLAAHASWEKLAEQIDRFHPSAAVLMDQEAYRKLEACGPFEGTRLLFGEDAMLEEIARPEVDTVLSGIAGSAGLRASFTALEHSKILALANKESIVMAGPLLTALASEKGGTILPVDSEHSAVFQALAGRRIEDVSRIILTASGGPFRERDAETLESVTPEEALRHPTWKMGPKITIDSATMMNKALEIIEARWLFQIDPDRIEVVIHPQSVVHSMVEYLDGSVIAQMGPPDMRVPIQVALTWPNSVPGPGRKLDITAPFSLEFEPPNPETFPALALGFQAARAGGTMGAVLNAANEVAVERFLGGEINFPDISRLVEAVMRDHRTIESPTLDQICEADAEARRQAQQSPASHVSGF